MLETGPVSYTHLDVYKRQQPDKPVGESEKKQACEVDISEAEGPVTVSYTHLAIRNGFDFWYKGHITLQQGDLMTAIELFSNGMEACLLYTSRCV